MQNTILNKRLSFEEVQIILSDIFGYYVDDDGIIFDEYFNEYEGENPLHTIGSIIYHAQTLAKQEGREEVQQEIKKALSL